MIGDDTDRETEDMQDEINKVAVCVLETMRLNGHINDIKPSILICGYLQGAAMFACLHLKHTADAGFAQRMGEYLRESIEYCRMAVADGESRRETHQ